jgi:inorganic pyrophosphatase
MKRARLTELDAMADSSPGTINVIVETPGGSRNKFKYDPKHDVIQYGKSLPDGAVFPHDFGFIPSTLAEDDDPLDVMVFMDDPTFPGVLIEARLIGVIEAEQSEEGKTTRNDRLIAVAAKCQDYRNVKALDDLDANLLEQIEHFFVSYNQMEGKEFRPLGRGAAAEAMALVEEGRKRYRAERRD